MEKNTCIACSVEQCRHHAEHENFCTLDRIKVGTHVADPTSCKCADCESFAMK